MKPVISCLLVLFTLLSCTKNNAGADPYNTIPGSQDTTPPRSLLALGDSYTIGQSVPVTDRFPVQAIKSLANTGTRFNDPEIIARTGWTTSNLLDAIAFTPPTKQQYDIVTLLIGVNNQYQHRTQQEYADQFSVLLGKALVYAGNNKKRVIVLSIPDYSVTPYVYGSDKPLIAKQVDSFNLINRNIATLSGVNYLDITGYSRLAENDPSLIAADGLHPSGLEYKVWAEALVPVIKKALQ